jgi:glycosyl-4,4'-diaponeurosporenoate acyltransferase
MRIVYLSRFWTIVIDSLAWAIIQPGIAYLSMRFPPSLLEPDAWLFRTRTWEEEGEIYDRLLKVRRWKGRLPSGGTLFAGGFSMGHVESREANYLRTWLIETCRAELCHWLAILPAALFFLWNPPWLGAIMVLYAVLFNAVPIVVQRHNRPRLRAILRRRERQGTSSPAP